jgi:hypothetical protein
MQDADPLTTKAQRVNLAVLQSFSRAVMQSCCRAVVSLYPVLDEEFLLVRLVSGSVLRRGF